MGVKEDLVTLLLAHLSSAALTWDDDETQATYDVLVGSPPHVLARDIIAEGYNCVFTVDDLRAEMRGLIRDEKGFEDGRYLIKTWAIEKGEDIDGVRLKGKMDDEVKRIFDENCTDRHIVRWEADNRTVSGTPVYCTVFTVAVAVYS